MRLLRRILVALVVLALLAYGGFIAGLYFLQRDFQYDPKGAVTALADAGLPDSVEAVQIPTADGTLLNGWYGFPQPGKPVILYYKGNAGSFSSEHERFAQFMADGYGFLAFDYRGFPASPGTITQDHILEDALAAYDFLGQGNFPIVIWGRSLGSGPATYVASLRDADALLLETPFLSTETVAQERYPFAPIGLLMADKFPVNEWIKNVDEPVFIAHGDADTTIDVSNGRRLYDLVFKKYDLWIEPGANHSDLWARGIWAKAKAFFQSVGD